MTATKPRLPILNRAHPLARGLVGAWLMYEGSGTQVQDVGPYRLHSTLTNLPSNGWSNGGPYLNFGAATNYYATRSDADALDMAVPFTIVTRLRRNSTVAYAGVISKGDASTATGLNYMFRAGAGGDPYFRYFSGSTEMSTTAVTISNGIWYTYACGWDGSVIWMWVCADGIGSSEVYVSGATTATPNVGSEPLIFGIADNLGIDTSRAWNGDIDYVQVIRRPLSLAEIHSLHADPYQAFRPSIRHAFLLTAAATTSTVALSWQDNSDSESGFSVERSSSSATSGFSEIDTVAANTTSYNDTGLAAGTYWYRVRAYDGSTYSGYSNVTEITVS